jgi:hypothetical protein
MSCLALGVCAMTRLFGRPGRWLSGEAGDLDEVVGKDPVAGPGASPGEGVQVGSPAAVVAFDGADAPFGAGTPSAWQATGHTLKRSGVFDGAAGSTGAATAGDADPGDAEVMEALLEGGFAIAAIGGDGAGPTSGEGVDIAALTRGRVR